MKYYHATSMSSYLNILKDETIKPGFDGLVYLTEEISHALRFVAIRGLKEIVVLEIEIPDAINVIETFDHSEAFFKCRSFGYQGSIPSNCIKNVIKYKF